MHGLLDDDPSRDVDHTAVLDERRVQRRESVRSIVGVAGQVPLECTIPAPVRHRNRIGQTPGQHTFRQVSQRGQPLRVAAVYEDKTAALHVRQAESPEIGGVDGGPVRPLELHARDRRYVRELPVLIPLRREPELGETLEGLAAHIPQPVAAASALREVLEARRVAVFSFHYRRHPRASSFTSLQTPSH